MGVAYPTYTVIQDTREQEGWEFRANPRKTRPPRCDGMVVETLKTGDYSLRGFEDLLTIERKHDFSEVWTNFEEQERFEQELLRMKAYRYRYVIIEAPMCRDIMKLSPPQYRTAMPGKGLVSWLMQLSLRFDVHMLFGGDCGQKLAQLIMENVFLMERERWSQLNPRLR